MPGEYNFVLMLKLCLWVQWLSIRRYSLDESVRILQLDVFLDTCVPSIAMAVRSTYAGTISANSLMIPLTAKARSDPNLQQTLERITNSIVNFEPSNTIQNRRIFVHHHQCSVIYHFKTYPKETFKYSVKMLKRLLLLDARLDKTDVSTIYSDSLDMKYHRTMGEILSMLMNELNSIEMLALLQEYDVVLQSFEAIKIFLFCFLFSALFILRASRISTVNYARSCKMLKMSSELRTRLGFGGSATTLPSATRNVEPSLKRRRHNSPPKCQPIQIDKRSCEESKRFWNPGTSIMYALST